MINSFSFLEHCTTQLLQQKAVQATYAEDADEKIQSVQRSLRQQLFRSKDLIVDLRVKSEQAAQLLLARQQSEAELQRVTLRLEGQLSLRNEIVKEAQAMFPIMQVAQEKNTDGVRSLIATFASMELRCEQKQVAAEVVSKERKVTQMKALASLLDSIEPVLGPHMTKLSAIPTEVDALQLRMKDLIAELERVRAETEANKQRTNEVKEQIHIIEINTEGLFSATNQTRQATAEKEHEVAQVLPLMIETTTAHRTVLQEQLATCVAERAKEEEQLNAHTAVLSRTMEEVAAHKATADAILHDGRYDALVALNQKLQEDIQGSEVKTATMEAEIKRTQEESSSLSQALLSVLQQSFIARAKYTEIESQMKAQIAVEQTRHKKRLESRANKRQMRVRNGQEKIRQRIVEEEAHRRERAEFIALNWMGNAAHVWQSETEYRHYVLNSQAEEHKRYMAQFTSGLEALTEQFNKSRSTATAKRSRISPSSPAMSEMSLFRDKPYEPTTITKQRTVEAASPVMVAPRQLIVPTTTSRRILTTVPPPQAAGTGATTPPGAALSSKFRSTTTKKTSAGKTSTSKELNFFDEDF